MKALFVHDNRFWVNNDNVYSYGHFAYSLLWKRYLKYFDSVTVGGRFFEASADECKTMSISNGKNVNFFPLPNLATLSGLSKIREAHSIIREKMAESDFVIIRLPSILGYVACDEAIKMKKPYAVEVVGCAHDVYTNHSNIGKCLSPIMTFLEKKYVKRAPNVLYVSRHFLQNRYPNKHFNISCPDTNITCFDTSVLERRLKKINQMAAQAEIRIGLIASLNDDYKGHDTAIKAVSLLKEKYPSIKLCFLGDGNQDRWKQYSKEYDVLKHIEFCGALPGGAPVLNWLDEIDIFIMPSLQETLGRALVEAMSRACPAIGGAGTAVPEQLPDDCIHERKNHKQLAEMIMYMIEHPNYMKICAEENFVRSKKYSEYILEERRDYFWKTAGGRFEEN